MEGDRSPSWMKISRSCLKSMLCGAFVWVLLVSAEADKAAAIPIGDFHAIPSDTQAGGHPDIGTTLVVQNHESRQFPPEILNGCACEDAKEIVVHLPPGTVGAPEAAPKCNAAEFQTDQCPVDSQVGVVDVGVNIFFAFNAGFIAPIYNMVPRPGEPGLTAFKVGLFQTPTFAQLSSRTGSDYGLDIRITGIGHITPLQSVRTLYWGVPGDPKNDPLRFPFRQTPMATWLGFGQIPGDEPLDDSFCTESLGEISNDPATWQVACEPDVRVNLGAEFNSPIRPFLQNATTCATSLTASVETFGYDQSRETATAPFGIDGQITGCDQLSFSPSLSAVPTSEEADSAAGVDINLSVPQVQSATVPSPSQIRATTVTLPDEFSLNANAADGKVACTDEQAMLGTEDEAQCPEFAKIGTLEIESSLLPGVMPGAIYIGEPKTGERFRILLVADGFGTHLKLPGTLLPDPQTGRITVSFQDLPQTPLTEFRMHFFGSERGALATPTRCGRYPVNSTFVPWNEELPNQSSRQFFDVVSGPNGTPCPVAQRPFDPSFEAGSAINTGGSHTAFSLNFARGDGEQTLSAVEVEMPPGFSARLSGVPYCPESTIRMLQSAAHTGVAELASNACPLASQVGTTTAGAGAGTRPVHLAGKVFLAGPYRGAPLSLFIVVPAVTGPYDLGNVTVRTAVHVDPLTAQVTAIADPLPQILEGVPLRTRSVYVELNRPNFALNPTNCRPLSVEATLLGSEGTTAVESAPFQVADCAALRFRPRLRLALRGNTKRRGHPAFRTALTARPGEAAIRKVQVRLPQGQLLDNSHIQTICTKPAFAARKCPEGSRIGRAVTITPLLDNPLTGAVYLRASANRLPDLAVDLRGQVDVELVGRIDSVRESLRVTFPSIPDVPVSRFVLNMFGGSKGLVTNSETLCGARKRARVSMVGQNGREITETIPMHAACDRRSQKSRVRQGLRRARGLASR